MAMTHAAPAVSLSAAPTLVELVLRWQGRVVDVKRWRPGTAITIGAPASGQGDVDLFVPLEGGGTHALFSTTGELQIPPGAAVSADDDGAVTLGLGLHSLELRRAEKERDGAAASVFDAFWANVVVVVLLGGTAAMAAFFLAPAPLDNLDDDLFANPTRYQALVLAPQPKDNAFLERMTAPTRKADPAKKKTTTEKTQVAAAATTTKAKKSRSDAEVVNARLESLFGAGNSGLAAVFHNDDDGPLTAAIAGLRADRVASRGELTLKGRPGEGGLPTGVLGAGTVGVRSRGRSGEVIGDTDGGLTAKEDHDISVAIDTGVAIVGALDPDIIRRVVREHSPQVRYCYEKELNVSPGLSGKIAVRWMIGPDGKVTSASITDSSMNSAAVEACLKNRVMTWRFPSPRGGGSVVVNYPFLFKKAGG